MNSLLCNWFDDWGRSIKNGLGTSWLIVLIILFAFISFYLIFNIFKASVNKTKLAFKWGQILFLIIFVLFIVWFSILL